METKVRCPHCSPHPVLAVERGGEIYVKCRCCKREVNVSHMASETCPARENNIENQISREDLVDVWHDGKIKQGKFTGITTFSPEMNFISGVFIVDGEETRVMAKNVIRFSDTREKEYLKD